MTTTKVLIATPNRWSVTKPAGALAPDVMNTHPSVSRATIFWSRHGATEPIPDLGDDYRTLNVGLPTALLRRPQ